jgi:hypothetical protein
MEKKKSINGNARVYLTRPCMDTTTDVDDVGVTMLL